MKPVKLAGLEPAALFGYFEKLTTIPHGSGNTRAISDYFLEFSAEHGLDCHRDEAGNVFIFKKATPGYEDHAPVILQAHMDMVCQKKEDFTLDMEKDPLDVTHDGTFVFARGTSLGGDDGAGIALCLTILADDTLAHPALEILFTTDEETGMIGATKMDLSSFKGRQLINLDGANEKHFIAGCAGGTRVVMEMPLQKAPVQGALVNIRLDQLHGGHSGGLIHLPFANASKVLIELLQQLRQVAPFRLADFIGGTAGNAIPKASEATLVMDPADISKVQPLCDKCLADLKANFNEPEAIVEVAQKGEAEVAYTEDSTDAIMNLLTELPNGMLDYFERFKIAMTSLNLGIVKTDDTLWLQTNVRSNDNDARQTLKAKLKAIAEKYGCQFSLTGDYPAWEYREDSPLRKAMTKVYVAQFGKEPGLHVTHAGLECGLIGEKLPGLDCVSMGTNLHFIHTADEKLEIAPFGRSLEFLKNVLKEL